RPASCAGDAKTMRTTINNDKDVYTAAAGRPAERGGATARAVITQDRWRPHVRGRKNEHGFEFELLAVDCCQSDHRRNGDAVQPVMGAGRCTGPAGRSCEEW